VVLLTSAICRVHLTQVQAGNLKLPPGRCVQSLLPVPRCHLDWELELPDSHSLKFSCTITALAAEPTSTWAHRDCQCTWHLQVSSFHTILRRPGVPLVPLPRSCSRAARGRSTTNLLYHIYKYFVQYLPAEETSSLPPLFQRTSPCQCSSLHYLPQVLAEVMLDNLPQARKQELQR